MNNHLDIVVVGLGYVGLPLALHLAKRGKFVRGFDKDINKVLSLKHGHSYVDDVSDSELAKAVHAGYFTCSLPNQDLKKAKHIIITVPTPFNQHKGVPDLSALLSAADFIADHLEKGQTIILESSTYPGTTEEVLLPILEKRGFAVGTDFFLGYSPERIDPGNQAYSLDQIPKVVSGVTASCLEQVVLLYRDCFLQLVPVSSPRVAELCKLFENMQRLVNISLVNEMDLICEQMGISFRESLGAAATKPFGFTPYFPGPGIGGHCIPVDPQYFQWKAAQLGVRSKLVDEALRVNKFMPKAVVRRIERVLIGQRAAQLNSSARILLLGLTYKKDVRDLRESPAIEIFRLLLSKGYQVEYHDPLVPKVKLSREWRHSVPLTAHTLEQADVTVILTDHSQIEWPLVETHARKLVDTRGITKRGGV